MAPTVLSEGNTKTSLVRIIASKKWCFTWNNYPDNFMDLMAPHISLFKDYIFGQEIGASGTKHIQGYINFFSKQRPIEKLKLSTDIHWEKAKGSYQENYNYCSKDNSFITNMVNQTIKDPLEGVELYPWQKDIISIVSGEPDPRKIYWYWSTEGCKGKTSLAKHICLKFRYAIVLDGVGRDILFGVSKFIETNNFLNIAIFNIVRDENHRGVSYKSMEKIKDGLFFSGKYESSMQIFNAPHIVIFANFPPDTEKLSPDRWIIKELL